ncbi:MAG: hypothetical protein R3B06_00690 [Kofleriaceae bacterium]
MLHRVLMSMSLVLGLATAACVEPAPSDEPTSDPVELDTAVDLADPGAAGDVLGQSEAVNGPEALCGRTFCGPRQPWTTCYCYVGSGLYATSTCSQGCRWDPTD